MMEMLRRVESHLAFIRMLHMEKAEGPGFNSWNRRGAFLGFPWVLQFFHPLKPPLSGESVVAVCRRAEDHVMTNEAASLSLHIAALTT